MDRHRNVVPGDDPREEVQDGLEVAGWYTDSAGTLQRQFNASGYDQNIYGNSFVIPSRRAGPGLRPGPVASRLEASGFLVGSAVFKTVEGATSSLAGSIPVRLRNASQVPGRSSTDFRLARNRVLSFAIILLIIGVITRIIPMVRAAPAT